MAKYMECIPLAAIERIAVVFGGGRSMAQVKGDADFIMNGGFYNMTTGKPVGHLKSNGTVHARPEWSEWGYTWDKGDDIHLAVIPDKGGKNYLTATKLIAGSLGPADKLTYRAEIAGARQRTAMARTADGLILYCTDDPTTPETVRDELAAMGAESALMLDGGGSSQCDFQGKTISSARRVNHYIAVWLRKSGENPEEGEQSMSKRVVLDPGHGVETSGKCAPDGTYYEHEFALDMCKRVTFLLTQYGVEVYQTRTDEHNLTNYERAELSNKWAPDLFVSFHSNAAGSGAEWMGVRGYGIYTSVAGDSAGRNIAAKAILTRAEQAGIHLWGEGLHHASFTVLTKTNAPAVLIEHLFHDNREDVALLKDDAFRDKLAKVDAGGILDYLGIPWREEAAGNEEETKSGICCPYCGGRLKIAKEDT